MPQLRRYSTDVDKPHLMYAPGNRAQPGQWVCQSRGCYATADTPERAYQLMRWNERAEQLIAAYNAPYIQRTMTFTEPNEQRKPTFLDRLKGLFK